MRSKSKRSIKLNSGFSRWLDLYIDKRLGGAKDDISNLTNENKSIIRQISECRKSLNKRISKIEKEEYRFVITDLNKRLKNNRAKKREFQNNLNNTYTEPANETYKLLLNHKLITSVIADDNILRISTVKLKNNSGGALGRYEINIHSNSYSYEIYNLDYRCDDYHHYNINEDGDPCLGDVHDVIDNYEDVASLRLVIDTLLHFLMNSYNPDDNYVTKTEWSKHKTKINDRN